MQTARDAMFVMLLAGLVFFTNLGGPRLWDRDEPRNAGCAWEMIERGDWVTPVFNDELRSHKPVLLYWFTMAAYAVFGVNEFAARFWSATLAVGTTLMVYGIATRLFDRRTGLWSAIILPSTLMFSVAARAATPDSLLIFFTTAALFVYVMSSFEPSSREAVRPGGWRAWSSYFPRRWWQAALMYAFMGMAVLAKGPVGLVLPTAVIGMFLLIAWYPADSTPLEPGWRGRIQRLARLPGHFLSTCWRMRPLTALAVALSIAAPWYVWVALRTDGQWVREFLFTHNLGRATVAMEGHGGSIVYYPVAILVGFFPWSVFVVPTLIGLIYRLRRGDAWSPGYCLTACWVGVYVVLFSLARTKLPSYVTPCYPGLAMLTACFMRHWVEKQQVASRLWPRLALGSLALVGFVVLVAIPIAASLLLPGDEWLGLVGLIPLGGGALAFWWMEHAQHRRAALAVAATALTAVVAVFGFVAVHVDSHRRADEMLAAIYQRSDSPRIGTYGCLEPSWVFYARRPMYELYIHDEELPPDRVPYPGRSKWLPRAKVRVSDFVAQSPPAFIITTRDRVERLSSELPEGAEVICETPMFLRNEELVVLGPISQRRLVRQDLETGDRR